MVEITLKEAQDELREKFNRGEISTCPCCKQTVKMYKRNIHATMAKALINLYRLGGWQHLREIYGLDKDDKAAISTDFATFKHWGLIEQQENEDKTKRTSGVWRITQAGIDFVNKRMTVYKYVKIYNTQFLGFDKSKRVTILDCLGKKFDYHELMHA